MTDVNSALIEHLRQRAAFGKNKYGVELTAFNGRNPLKDKREELLDALVYNEQDILEREALTDLIERTISILHDLYANARVFGMRSDMTLDLIDELCQMAVKLRQDIKRIEPEEA